jgi:hypothetical protein
MATRSSSKVGAGTPAKGLRAGLVAVSAVYSVGAALSLSAGDVIQMINVPKGAKVVDIKVSGGSGDALIAVGDGDSNARYIDYATMASASTTVRTISLHAKMIPYEYSVDDTIDLYVSTVSVGTITGGFHMTAIFSMDTA